MQTDYQGEPVPPDETPDSLIEVWVVDPHPSSRSHDVLVSRSWQDMLDHVGGNLDTLLERTGPAQWREGVTLTIRLRTMRKWEYDEIVDRGQD